jgi:hypothetical protein
MACWNSIAANVTTLGTAKMEDLDMGRPGSADALLEVLLALVDMALPVMCAYQHASASNRHLAGLVAGALDLTQDAVGLLVRFGVVGRPCSAKGQLAASVLRGERLERWFGCLAEAGGREPIAGDVAALLLHAITRNILTAGGGVKQGAMDISAAEAAEVRPGRGRAPAEAL